MKYYVLSFKNYSRRNVFGIFINLFLVLHGVIVLSVNSFAQEQQPININKFEIKENSSPCIPDSLYKRMEEEWKKERGQRGTESTIFPLFEWVLEGPMFDKYNVGNYVDDNPTVNVIQDYMGNPHSYDGHRGTDIGIAHFRAMDQGIGIIAGAAGTVVSAPYQHYDRETSWPGSSSGNGVTIKHDDGTRAVYWHMRKNSVTVNVGERVETGKLLGLVGSSGTSTAAHLHFETQNSHGTARDPWSGTFNTLQSLWQNQNPYVRDQEFWVRDAGLSTQLAVGGNLGNIPGYWWSERISQPAVFGIDEPFIMVWLYFFSKANDSYRIEIRKPNNTLYGSATYNITEVWRGGNHYWYWNFSPNVSSSDYGTWKYRILSEGVLLKEIPFEVGPTTVFGPRFFPLAGKSLRLGITTQIDILRVSSLGSGVTYSLLNAPPYVSLLADSIVSIASSANPIRSSYFQALATDGNGRTDTMWYHIVNPNAQPLMLRKGNISCKGSGNGSITASFGSGAGYSISLNGGEFVPATTPFVFTNLDTGLYSITLKDAYGSTESDTVSFSEPTAISLALSKTDIICNGSHTGEIEAIFNGGTPGYCLKIDSGSFISATSPYTFSNLAAGMHVVTLRDTGNCLFIDSIQIEQPPAIPMEFSTTDATCHGNSDGSITALFPDSLGHTIRLDDGSFDALTSPHTFTGLAAGIHIVTLRNSIGCLRSDSILVQQPAALSIIFTRTPPSTVSSSDGSISVEFGGGTPGYLISFNGGAFEPAISPQTFSNLANGVYHTVTIRDTQNCELTDSAQLNFIGTIEYQFAQRWNLVSLPLSMAEYHIDSLFPSATSLGFRFDRFGYHSETTLMKNVGYWMKFLNEQTLIHQGVRHEHDTILVDEGWNLIGSHYQPVAVTDILSDVDEMITSNFYGYNQGYVVTDTIKPGRAYWVKVNQPGVIILSSSIGNGYAKSEPLAGITILPTGELPPAPPEQSTAYLNPEVYTLSQNYPNPFNPSTVISYQLPVDSWVTLKVYTMLGEEVTTLAHEFQASGVKSLVWDASGLASGMYYYRLQAGNFTETKKILLTK